MPNSEKTKFTIYDYPKNKFDSFYECQKHRPKTRKTVKNRTKISKIAERIQNNLSSKQDKV